MRKKISSLLRPIFFEKKNIDLVRTSDLFDAEWYLARYPDVAAAGIDPAFHYLKYGGFEGRDPGPKFSSFSYLENYPDVEQAKINPLVHYLLYGKKEGRKVFFIVIQNQEPVKAGTFLESYLFEIITNVHNDHSDNYDFYRFGPSQEIQRAGSWNISKTISRILRNRGFTSTDLLSSSLVRAIELISSSLSHLENVYCQLEDSESRDLMVKILAYRALGYKKVKLPLNTPKFWQEIESLKKFADFTESKFFPFGSIVFELPLFDLKPHGIPIKLFLSLRGVYNQFILEQYRCAGSPVKIEVEPGDIVIDSGGCWGDTALKFAHQAGKSGKVFSFEFMPGNLEIFAENLELNPEIGDRVNIIKRAVWEESNIKLHFSDNGPASSANLDGDNSGFEAETLTIDDLVKQKKLMHVDFIKMDIEGAELKALKGAINTLKMYHPKLAISLYHNLDDFWEIPEFLLSLNLGYRLYIRHYTINAEETVLYAEAKKI